MDGSKVVARIAVAFFIFVISVAFTLMLSGVFGVYARCVWEAFMVGWNLF